MTLFTVIVPTYDHADTLWFSLGSVFAQTVQDFEIVVVGDGAPERTGEIVRAFAERDPRIRYELTPKGERHGEAARHRAVESANGTYVAYLSDDDLWFPDHLETLAGMLRDCDVAHTMQIDVTPEGEAHTWIFDADADPLALEAMRRNDNGFGLASGAHTRGAYLRLPYGWRAAPLGINSDTYFWLQFLDRLWCRYASHKWPTVIHSSRIPTDWPAARRAAALGEIAMCLPDPAWRQQLVRRAMVPLHDRVVADAARLQAALAAAQAQPYRYGETVRFGVRGNAYRYAVAGTHEAETWGSWANGTMRIVLPIEQDAAAPNGTAGGTPDATPRQLKIALSHFLAGPARSSSTARIRVNGKDLGEIEETESGPREYTFPVDPPRNGDPSSYEIEIEGVAPASPRAIGTGHDARELSVGVVSLSIAEA
ncbi:MAG TPA: glycosyltransferase family 2 protein [Candidatus Elarobacter sp.]|jgi:hypothetical protein